MEGTMRDQAARWRLITPLALLMLAMLACGGFQVRVTPSPAPPTETPEPATPETAAATPTVAATEDAADGATATATVAPTAAPAQPGALAVGGTAKVNVSGGLNMREQPTRQSKQVGKLNSGVVVTIIGGPTQADNYTWWQVDNGSGLKGWVAEGSGADKWLAPEAAPAPSTGGGGRLVNRPIQLGDTVQVTTDGTQVLTVRQEAGLSGTAVARVLRGTEFVVRGGPVRQDELLWWQLENDKVKGWAAEGRGEDRWLTPFER
jgi:hypothetical protein